MTNWLKDMYSNVMKKMVLIIMTIMCTLVCLRDIIWVRYDDDHNAHKNGQFSREGIQSGFFQAPISSCNVNISTLSVFNSFCLTLL